VSRKTWLGWAGCALLVSACLQSAGVNPTGLAGGQVACGADGSRPTLDCRGALQQFARDLKADLSYMSQAQIGLTVGTTKLAEADALSSDLIQHYYQTCTLYNACVISGQEYAAKTDKLQSVQLDLRRALTGIVSAQQNISINPPGPYPTPGFSQPGVPSGYPPPQGGQLPGGGLPTSGFPRATGEASATPRIDAVLDILRDGSRSFRSVTAVPGQQPAPTQGDLDASLRALLQSIRRDVIRKQPALAQARAVVGNFTEDGKAWSSPLGATLQDRVSSIVASDRLFQSPRQTRGITIKEVSSVANPNDPKALNTLYGSDVAIVGTYRVQEDRVRLQLVAVDGQGAQLAKAQDDIPRTSIPNVLATAPSNAADTANLLGTLGEADPQSADRSRVRVTTNRPGAGASFRLGEEIRYFVTSATDGYLYLFHVDGSNRATRIYPNDYQREASVQAGRTVSVPPDGATFRFEASPPFALETTLAIVAPTPLTEAQLRMVAQGLAAPTTRSAVIRGVQQSTSPGNVAWGAVTVLIRP